MTIKRMKPADLFESFKRRKGRDAENLNEAKQEERRRQIEEEQYVDNDGKRRCTQCGGVLAENSTCVKCNDGTDLAIT